MPPFPSTRLAVLALLAQTLLCCKPSGQEAVPRPATPADSVVVLENNKAHFRMELHGGAFTDFHLKTQPLNPFTWKLTPEQMPANNRAGAPFRGHFLCTGRWGSPTPGEMAAGVPHNGEPANNWWSLKNRLPLSAESTADAPKDGLTVSRALFLHPEEALVRVEEEVKNLASWGRVYNFVQHPTLGPPFLGPQTVVDCNAGRGFLQSLCWPRPDAYAFAWPNGFADSLRTPLDLRRSDGTVNFVTTHVFSDTLGWIVASSPQSELLIGYLWDTRQYGWLNVWHHQEEGRPVAKGLEFGTSGIGRDYQDLVLPQAVFEGRTSFRYLDAGETHRYVYRMFLAPIPADFAGVETVQVKDGQLVLAEKGGTGRLVQLAYH